MKCETSEFSPSIVGKWRWVQSVGGIAGMTIKASATDTRQMNFNADKSFEFLMNNKVVTTSTYNIISAKSISSIDKVPMIVFDNDGFMKMSFSIKGDSLFLNDEVYDGFGSAYVRIK